MLAIKEAIIVEGRYDKHQLSGVVDTLILTTEGFSIFKQRDKRALLVRLAGTRGVIIFTDSDAAGFVIRNHLKGVLPAQGVKHAYIPDVFGKERRKTAPSKEGKLGVEGITKEVLEDCLRKAGATILGETATPRAADWLTKSDLYALGLSGGEGSGLKRKQLLKALALPEYMSADALLGVVNALYTPEEWTIIIEETIVNQL